MRALIIAFVGGLAFAASAHAPPLSAKPAAIKLGATLPVEPIAGGCEWDWHRRHWQDRWGNWHWGHCASDDGP